MTLIGALHGRTRMRAAGWQRLWLVELLFLAIQLLTLDYLVDYSSYLASHSATPNDIARAIFKADWVALCLGPLLAGVFIDSVGVTTVLGVVVVVWCGSVALAACLADPLSFRILWPLVGSLLPGLVLTCVLTTVRRAWPQRRRAVALAFLLIAYEYAVKPWGLYFSLFPYPESGRPETWQYPMFAMVTVGSVIAAVWLFGFREVDATTGLDLRPEPTQSLGATIRKMIAALKTPSIWSLLAIQFCVGIVHHYGKTSPWGFAALPASGQSINTHLASFAMPTGFLIAAAASDRIFQKTRSWTTARRPFVVAAFAANAVLPLMGRAAPQNGVALATIGAVALGVLHLADVLVVDLAPRSRPGGFIGVVLFAELVLASYVAPYLERLPADARGEAILVCLVATVGAVLSSTLIPRMRPAPA